MHPCPGCGCAEGLTLARGSDRLYHTTGEIFTVIECRDCGLVRLDPWPTPAESDRYYPPSYWFAPGASAAGKLEEAYRRFVLRDHVKFVLESLDNCLARGLILDIGCGGALFGRLLAEQGNPCVGIDYSRDAARVGWTTNGVPVVCGNVPTPPFRPKSFRAITMFHVLEHLHDAAGYLETAHALLEDGGRLIVQVPNASCWQFALFGDAWNGLDIPRHLINFRKQDLDALLNFSGFTPLRYKYFSLRDNPGRPGLDPCTLARSDGPESPRSKRTQLASFG